MSKHCEGLELIPEGAGPRTGHMRLAFVAIKGLQLGDQITLGPPDGANSMHVQDSRGHYRRSN